MIGKMITYNEENSINREMVENEIGIMMLNEGDSMIECYDSIERIKKPTAKVPNPKKEWWMMLEPMSGDLEQVICFCKEHNMSYDEDFISYICYRNIHALNFLHKRKIVHRDIKSDNILYNYKGEVKLADFGLSINLTTEQSTIKD